MDKITIERETLERLVRWIGGSRAIIETDLFNDLRAALAAQPAEPVALDNACMTEQAIDEYLSDYTMEGDSGSHTPDESELLVIKDAIMGLLVYPDFLASFAPPAPALTYEQIRDLAKESGLDWHRGYMPLFDDDPTNRYEVFARAVLAAGVLPAPAAVPPGYALVPIEPTRAMVETYLSANSAYWERIDAMPTKISVWRNGTPKEATEVSYRAMIAAAKPTAAVPPGMMLVPRAKLEQFRDAFAEELAAYDIDPPLHHVKQGHDDCVALLAASGEKT